MAVKPHGLDCRIKEQIIEDEVSGLTLQFDALPDGTFRLKISGDFPFGGRDWIFNSEGEEAGGGVGTCCTPRPSWLSAIP
ncbi:MAG: hypothetical protein WEC75_05445 [Dehalococcoidia bacterium]